MSVDKIEYKKKLSTDNAIYLFNKYIVATYQKAGVIKSMTHDLNPPLRLYINKDGDLVLDTLTEKDFIVENVWLCEDNERTAYLSFNNGYYMLKLMYVCTFTMSEILTDLRLEENEDHKVEIWKEWIKKQEIFNKLAEVQELLKKSSL